jgi:hypothetical protein
LEQAPVVSEEISRFSQTLLKEEEQRALAVGALVSRWGADEKDQPIKPEQLLRARRSYDVGNDLFRVMNRIQENVIKGGVRYRKFDSTGHFKGNQSTREVKSISDNITINKAIWAMAKHLEDFRRSSDVGKLG